MLRLFGYDFSTSYLSRLSSLLLLLMLNWIRDQSEGVCHITSIRIIMFTPVFASKVPFGFVTSVMVISLGVASANTQFEKCIQSIKQTPLVIYKFIDKDLRYPRKEMTAVLLQDRSLQRRIRQHVRYQHIQNRFHLDEERIPVNNGPFIRHTCTRKYRYLYMNRFVEDPQNGDCWVLRPWWNKRILWAFCDRFCSHVKSVPPLFAYTCVPGNYRAHQFWTYCPSTNSFFLRRIVVPKCCFCEKLTCLFKPRIVPWG